MQYGSSGRVTVVDHPLVEHKLSIIRNEATPSSVFRQTVRELTLLEGFEATKDLATSPVDVRTPLAECRCRTIAGHEPVIVPILRAGLGMLEGMLDLIPTASVAHLGMKRDEKTHEPVEYYANVPARVGERQVILVDPMLATGGSLCAALDALRKRGARDVVACVIVACPEGIEAVLAHDPDVRLFACAVDERLNDDAYIVPGLGDAGDRIFGTVGA